MLVLAGIAGLFALLAVFFLGRAVVNLRRRKVLRACGSSVCSVGSLSLAAPALLLVFSYYGYARLTDEQTICQVEFSQVADSEYSARLMISGQRDQVFRLLGNEWQIDARLLNWKPPLTLLGLDPIYQLERISGRYSDIGREQSEPRTVHALSADRGFDAWKLAGKYPFLMPGVDAYYGAATYVPMADGAKFAVSLSRDALIARPANDIASDIVRRWNSNAQ